MITTNAFTSKTHTQSLSTYLCLLSPHVFGTNGGKPYQLGRQFPYSHLSRTFHQINGLPTLAPLSMGHLHLYLSNPTK